MKTVLRIVAVLVLLAAAAAGWAGYEAWTFLKTPPATPGQEAFFDVEPGANVRRVADKLEERGLITDARKFLLLARYKKWDSRLQAGRFALNTGWLPEQVLDTLVNGQPVLFCSLIWKAPFVFGDKKRPQPPQKAITVIHVQIQFSRS